MTLKYMQGFDSCRDDSDVRSQGLSASNSKWTTVLVPSITSVSGTSMALTAPYGTTATTAGAAGAKDPAYMNLGFTVNQAWTAGGFTIGFGGKFNSQTNASYGAGLNGWTNSEMCFDGTLYWAMRAVGAVYTIATSPDLVNWTATASQPVTTNNATNVAYLGGGVIAVLPNQVSASVPVYYTSNGGISWSTATLYTAGAPVGGTAGTGLATGNGTNPHVIVMGNNGGGTSGGMFVGTISGTMTNVVAASASQILAGRIKIIGSLIMYSAPNEIYTASGTNFTTGSKATHTAGAGGMDITYIASSNLFVICGANGIYTTPNTGASGTPVAPTGAITVTQRYSTAAINNLFTVGSVVVGVGNSGHIVTSPDGITWTESGQHILPVGTAGTDWRCTFFDGTQYVLCSDATNGVIAVSPNLQTNFQCKYVLESSTENAYSTSTSFGNLSIYSASTPGVSATGTFTVVNGFALQVGPPSGGTRSMALYGSSGSSVAMGNVTTSPLFHYYELHFVPTATNNTFTVTLRVDAAQLGASVTTTWSSGSSTDVLVLAIPRLGQFTMFDDIYVTLNDAVANTAQGPLGEVKVIARRPTTDSAVQWVKSGAAASNALSVNQSAISSLSTNAVTSANAADKDTYTSTDTIPSGYTAKAISVEGYFARTSGATPTVNIGVVSGSTEVDSSAANITLATPTYVSTIIERDPNGSIAWTNSAVIASKIALNHTA